MVSLDELLGMRDAFVAFRVFAGIGCVFEYGFLQVVDTLACWRRWRARSSVRVVPNLVHGASNIFVVQKHVSRCPIAF